MIGIHPQYRATMQRKLALLALLAALTLVAWLLPAPPLSHRIAGYQPLHALLETVAVTIATLIFAVGWRSRSRALPGNIVVLACAFAGVALLDFSHGLSYTGMPDYVTPASPEKAIEFWLAARLLAALALLAAALLPWQPLRRRWLGRAVLGGVLALTAATHWVFLYHPEWMTRRLVAGGRRTPDEIAAEWTLVLLYAGAAALLWWRMRKPQPFNAAALFAAACAAAASELLFTFNQGATDVYNLLGHVYKIVAYGCIYGGIFVETIERPFHELQTARLQLHSILQAIPDLFWLKEPDGRVIECNLALERLHDRPREQILGRTDAELLEPQRAAEVRASDLHALAAAQPVVEERWLTMARDGGRGLFEIVKTPMRDARGQVVGLLGLARDVTAARRDQEALRHSNERLRQAVRVAQIGIFERDEVGGAVYWSFRMRELFGLAHDEAVSRDLCLRLVHPEDHDRVTQAMHRALDPAGNGGLDVEYRIVRADGRTRHLATRSQTLFAGDGAARRAVRTTGAVLDVTERTLQESELRLLAATLEARVERRTRELARRNEELMRSERLAALGSLVAGVAHELNTPIGNAVMVASTLADRQREFEAALSAGGLRRSTLENFIATTREVSDVLERNLARAAELIGGFKQVAVDQSSHQRRRFALDEVVQEIVLALRPTLRRSRVEVTDAAASGLLMDSFPGALGQVLINLVNNAVQHAFEGREGGSVHIAAVPLGKDRVVLEVADDGSGVPPEHLDRIFDPYFSTQLGRGGSGLGLHIVFTLVSGVLGGRITVASTGGRGTVFRVELPLVALAAAPAVSALA